MNKELINSNKEKLNNLLNEKHAGFMGNTHWLMTMAIFFLMWIIPWQFSKDFISSINSSKIFVFLVFLVIGGASLICDLDSNPLQGGGSTAIYQLGILGELLSLLEITISGVVYGIFHTKYDKKPESQHRMLFHAPIIPIVIYFYTIYKIPDSSSTLKDNLNFENAGIIFLAFCCACAIYLGSNMLIYKILKLIRKQGSTQFICLGIMVISIIMLLTLPYSRLKLLFKAFSLGYLFHIIEDVFSKGSAPLFFPIPIPVSLKKLTHFRLWWHPYFISSKFTITTGGIMNIILNYIMMGIDLILAWYVFAK